VYARPLHGPDAGDIPLNRCGSAAPVQNATTRHSWTPPQSRLRS